MQDYERFDALGLADLVRRGEVDASELLDAMVFVSPSRPFRAALVGGTRL